MPEFFFKINGSDLGYVEQMLDGIANGMPKAVSAAVNETMRKFRTKLVDLIDDVLLAKKGEIRDRVKVVRTSSSKSVDAIEGKVTVSYGALPLHDFKIRYTKRSGASAQMLASQPVQSFKFAFKGTMNSGHVGAFQSEPLKPKRAPRTGSYKGRILTRGPRKGLLMLRKPVKELFGVPVVRAFELDPSLTEKASANMGTLFKQSLDRKVDWILKSGGKSAG